jgi:hypothetical protein
MTGGMPSNTDKTVGEPSKSTKRMTTKNDDQKQSREQRLYGYVTLGRVTESIERYQFLVGVKRKREIRA